MIRGRDRGSNDALVCADVLGAFGVAPSDVRRRADGDASLEAALSDALADARDRTEFCRRTICRSDRGIDCPARYAADDLRAEVRALFDGLGWEASFAGRGDGLGPRDALGGRDDGFALTVTDRVGRRRELEFTYPETPLGPDNFPAALASLEERLLAGVDARFVLLSDGDDRWRAALIETDELERIRDRYGDRVTAFDRPLLAAFEPTDYVPVRGSDGRGTDGDPWPGWTTNGSARGAKYPPTEEPTGPARSLRGPADGIGAGNGRTGVDELIEEAEPGGEDDASGATGEKRTRVADERSDGDVDERSGEPDRWDGGGTERSGESGDRVETGPGWNPTRDDRDTDDDTDGSARGTGTDAAGNEAAGDEATDDGSMNADGDGGRTANTTLGELWTSDDDRGTEDGGDPNAAPRGSSGAESSASEPVPDGSNSGSRSAATASDASSTDETGSSTGGLTLAGGSPKVSRVGGGGSDSSGSTTESATSGPSSESSRHDSPGTSRDDSSAGNSNTGSSASDVSTRDARETETSGFGTLSGSAKTARVKNDSFGADVETQTEDEQYRALGAALGSGGDVTVKGLLDDDEFLPELPAVEPTTTRIEFEEAFEPEAVSSAKAEAEESGFVWVDSGSIETTRVSN